MSVESVNKDNEGETKSIVDDYDLEEKENERLKMQNFLEKPHLFVGTKLTKAYCDHCECDIDRDTEHYRCFDCPMFDLCVECYSNGEIHLHGEEDFIYRLTEPTWYFTLSISFDAERTVTSVLLDCFEFFSPRHFIGTRRSPEDKEFTWYKYCEIEKMMISLSKAMKNILDLKKGDFVCILSDIQVEPIVVWFASIYIGVTFVPIQSILPRDEKKYILEQTDAKVVFCGKEDVEEIRSLSKKVSSFRHVVQFPSIKPGNQDEEEGEEEEEEEDEKKKVFHFSDLISSGEKFEEKLEAEELENEDIICIVYTSGTTGLPKGIVYRERAWLSRMTRLCDKNPLVVFSYLPFSHMSGITFPFLSFFNGGRTGLLTQSDMNNLFDDFRILRPTYLATIPRVLNFVCAEYYRRVKESSSEEDVRKEMRNVFGGRVTEIAIGSAHCSSRVKRLIRDLCQVPVYDGYGISEVGTVSYNYKVAHGNDIRLLDCPELGYTSNDMPFPRGELLVKNDLTMMLEYYKDTESSKRKFDSEGYFHTGDIVEKRGDRIIIIDRKNNIIKLSQGEFVSLENIELVLESSVYIDKIILVVDDTKTFLFGLVSVGEEYWEGRIGQDKLVGLGKKAKGEQDLFQLIKTDIEKIGRENELNSWEFPSSVRLIFEKFPLTELKKKNRKRVVSKYLALVEEMNKEIEVKINTDESKSPSDFKDLLENLLGFSISQTEESYSKNLQQLGVKSFSGIVLRNFIEKKCGKRLSFSELMKLPVSKLLEIIADPEEYSDVRTPKYIDLSDEEEKFKKFMIELRNRYPLPNDHSEKLKLWIERPNSILLTGSTGFLGQSVLKNLIVTYPNTKILCLVRKRKNDHPNNVVNIIGDLSLPFFGMFSTEEEFENFFGSVDLIFHCGAMVNHFADYEDHYATNVGSLYDICRISKGYKPFIYTSSLSIFRSRMPIPKSIENILFPFDEGYAGSKWVVDCLVRKFIPSSSFLVCRLNLLIGDTFDGRMNVKDWMTSILYSCVDLNMVPITTGTCFLDMLPVNQVSQTMVMLGLILGRGAVNFSFLNCDTDEFMGILYEVRKDEGMKKVSWERWIRELEARIKVTNQKKGYVHPITPFLARFKMAGRFGRLRNEHIPMIMGDNKNLLAQQQEEDRLEKMLRKGWRKVTVEDMKKYVDFILSSNM